MAFTYAQAKEYRASLEANERAASEALQAFPRLANGLTPDAAKTPEWKAARARYSKAFADLRDYNGRMARNFKAEMKAERDAKKVSRGG